MVIKERAKPAAQPRSHFLPLIRWNPWAGFSLGRRMRTGSSAHISQNQCPRSQLINKILLTPQRAEGKPDLPHAQNSKVSHPMIAGTGFAVKNRHEKQSCEMAPVGVQLQPAAKLKTLPQFFNSGELLGKRPFLSTPKW